MKTTVSIQHVQHSEHRGQAGKSAGSILLSLSVLILAACSGQQYGDLQSFIDEEKARKPKRIAPLPEVKPYESFAYQAADIRDPFVPFVEEEVSERVDTGIRPDMNRKREALEQFPLDTLRFVGHLEKGGVRWGLIVAPDKSVYRVKAGNHLGKNYGEIESISETEIKLKEIIPNGTGGWLDREASLALSE